MEVKIIYKNGCKIILSHLEKIEQKGNYVVFHFVDGIVNMDSTNDMTSLEITPAQISACVQVLMKKVYLLYVRKYNIFVNDYTLCVYKCETEDISHNGRNDLQDV